MESDGHWGTWWGLKEMFELLFPALLSKLQDKCNANLNVNSNPVEEKGWALVVAYGKQDDSDAAFISQYHRST